MRGRPQPWDEEESLPEDLVWAHRSGRDEATGMLYERLRAPVRQAVEAFLGSASPDVDDVVQESVLATLDYLKRSREFRGNLVRFAVVVARNRCRNLFHWRRRWGSESMDALVDWVEDPSRSPLDLVHEEQVQSLLREALRALDGECRRLLTSSYLEGRPMEDLRREMGLGSVQGAYYRRQVCLRKALSALKRRLGNCSLGEVGIDE